MKFAYLLIDIATLLLPFLFSFHPKINFYRKFKPLVLANLASATCFIIWDIIFTDRGIWSFNGNYITGVHLANLPIEEILFFFCIPFSCVFTYYCFDRFNKKSSNRNTTERFTFFLSMVLLIVGVAFWRQAYTSVTFISTSIILFLVQFILHERWLGNLYRAYAFLLIPFFIVNGILTGTGLAEPIVRYNDADTLRLRILTIPVEDVVYGFELFLLTVFLYETFTGGRTKNHQSINPIISHE